MILSWLSLRSLTHVTPTSSTRRVLFLAFSGPIFGWLISAAWPRSRPSRLPVICLGATCFSLLLLVFSQRPSVFTACLALFFSLFITLAGWWWHRLNTSSNNVRFAETPRSEGYPSAKTVAFENPEDPVPDVQQQQERWCDEAGIEHARGFLQVVIPAHATLATTHVGFVPPFQKPPVVTAECHSDLDVKLRVSQALWHGASFEIKLKSPQELASRVTVEYHAEAK
jgi:hypothetical protein